MLSSSGSAKKQNNSTNATSPSSSSIVSSGSSSKARKRKRYESEEFDEIELASQFNSIFMENAVSIEKKLRKVAEVNSLSDDEMRMLLQKFVKNDHILALVTLKAEDEVAREKREAEQRAIIITDTPSVPKLTRAKARELNKVPGKTLSPISISEMKSAESDIAALINDDLHSDDEDEEYTFKEEDFVSDDDPSTTASDIESNPRTPQTPLANTDYEDSPVKLTADGCFKIPMDRKCSETEEDLRIAARTRSKFCLEQKAIEDIESEFVPPDVEQVDFNDTDLTVLDDDWMQFLNDFSKPLSKTAVGDDDDPINDPEYIAADQVPIDAEELRDVNISKKELTELVAELFEGLVNESVLLETVDLETPERTKTTNANIEAAAREVVAQRNDLDVQNCISDATISSTNVTQVEYAFNPDAISTPSTGNLEVLNTPTKDASYVDINDTSTPEQPNYITVDCDTRYVTPYDNNYTCEYISIKRHVLTEHAGKFEHLRHTKTPEKMPVLSAVSQHHMLQQQLRIHVQLLTQHFVQTYSHPEFWNLAPKCKDMLMELHEMARTNTTFQAFNLESAVKLVHQWDDDLSKDTTENKDMMNFIHLEIAKTNRNTRQIPRFPPRIMDLIVNSNVFIYPKYLPRIPFTPKVSSYHVFAPSEAQLIAYGLEKHMTHIKESGDRISKKCTPIATACSRLPNDVIFGKNKRRVWDHMKCLKKSRFYNPVQYYFEHHRAPALRDVLVPLDNAHLPPKHRYDELPLMWQDYIKNQSIAVTPVERKHLPSSRAKASNRAKECYLECVKEVLGDTISAEAKSTIAAEVEEAVANGRSVRSRSACKESSSKSSALTVNVNYIFGASSDISNSVCPNWTQSTSPNRSTIVFSAPEQSAQESALPLDTDDVVPLSSEAASEAVGGEAKRRAFAVPLGLIYRSRRNYVSHARHRNRKSSLCLSRKCRQLLLVYSNVLRAHHERYASCPAVQRYYNAFKALELYTNLLKDLAMFCRNAASQRGHNGASGSGSPGLGKRARGGGGAAAVLAVDEAGGRSKKPNRHEENFRHMLLPESPENTNRKDAIFAYNFYEKVEEVLKSSDRPEDWKRFNQLLKSFHPNRDKVCDLYHKIEQLLLPDHPELVEVFLSFLLPSQAAEVGKFFEHFMITNVVTFVNKLNVYFSKQPAQIRKIYNCLNELAEEPNITVQQVETKILPLLKGNRVLRDWFIQQFPQEPPPDRLLPAAETVNLTEVLNNQNNDVFEHAPKLLETATPNEKNACQLRYINGRIFYGTKITLPAKLSFMATNYQYSNSQDENVESRVSANASACIHGIREHGEKRLMAAAANNTTMESNSSAVAKEKQLGEDEHGRATSTNIAASTAAEDASIETCDDATLRAHAIRLNPNYYGSACYSSSLNSAAGGGGTAVRKTAAGTTADESKTSPRKNQTNAAINSGAVNCLSPSTASLSLSPGANVVTSTTSATSGRDKRKSPTKKNRSPVCAAKPRTNPPPMVVIHEQTPSAIAYAKKLKSLIDEDEQERYTKAQIPIVARPKNHVTKSQHKANACTNENSCDLTRVPKTENADDLEFATTSSDSSVIFVESSRQPANGPAVVTHLDSDEEFKVDVVATLSTTTDAATASTRKMSSAAPSSKSPAFTRDEDKVILIEMKAGREDLLQRIHCKLGHRTLAEITDRHSFLMDFLSKLQGK